MKRALLITFVVLQVLDVVTTQRALASCGACYEGNPVVATAIEHFGAWWWVAKLGTMLCLVPILARLRTSFVAMACAFCAVVIANNILS